MEPKSQWGRRRDPIADIDWEERVVEKMKWRRHERGGKESENKEKKEEERKMVVKEERTTKIMPFEKNSAEQRQLEISCGRGRGSESRNPGVAC